nr:hypothetical protein GCM10025732_30620 [Glycomyces mayteni]
MSTRSRTVAVVGSGVAGLTAAHLLQRTADVTVYEADDRLGGHAHTHDVRLGDRSVAVDSGFIVHNRRTYPLLCRLFDELGVTTRPTEMSMSVQCLECGLEYCGARGASGLFARAANAADPRFWSLLAQVPRFHARARRLLADPGETEPTLGSSSPPGVSAPTSPTTSSSRSSRRSGPAAPTSSPTTRPDTCSRSSTTTGSCR